MNIFAGLEALGLGKLSKMDVYEEKEQQQKKAEKPKVAEHVMTETDFIFDKEIKCPVCDQSFKTKTVKTGRIKLVSADTDLKPTYQLIDPLKYDVIACPHCGYAALSRYFTFMTNGQAKLIRDNISSSFKGLAPEGDILSYDDALTRYKLALANAVVKRAKMSEKAYTCLKTAWLLRGKSDTLPGDTPDYDKVIEELKAEETEFLEKAYEGFLEAFHKELFPMCGMDENTVSYVVADLARRTGKPEEALKLLSRIITSRTANERIKSKARELKDLVLEEEKNGKQNNA